MPDPHPGPASHPTSRQELTEVPEPITDPYPLAADQQGVFVTAALVAALGPGPAITYSHLRWICEHSRHSPREDGWTKLVATQIADDIGLPVKTVRKHLADFAEQGWVERRQDLGAAFDRSSWWRLPTSQSGHSMSAKREHQMSSNRALVLSTETEETTTSGEARIGNMGAARAKTSPQPRRRTPADDLFDALLEVDGVEPGTKLTRTQGSMYGKLRRELTDVDASADDVRRRARRYRTLHPDWQLTAAALVKHWASLSPKRATPTGRTDRDYGDTADEFARVVFGDDQ
jgi:DNA-binding MarR family transcriptional regulator